MSNLEKKIDALLQLVAANTPAEREQAKEHIRTILDTGMPPQEEDVQSRIRQVLLELGVPDRIKGHSRLIKALELAIEDPHNMGNITKEFYPAVGAVFGTSGSSAERVMRHAIEVAWSRCDYETLQKYFGNTVSPDKGMPTTYEFIARVANVIRAGE